MVDDTTTTPHTLAVRNGLSYAATAGTYVLREKGEPTCSISFVAYVADGHEPSSRPVTFVFNGGPGSSAIWLHIGVLGPRRVSLGDGLRVRSAPHGVVDNPQTMLHATDLVFIDPVGTGHSRAADGVDESDFHGLEGDTRSVGDFIELWLTRNGRWGSPKYVLGESYGTTRAAALASHLLERHGLSLDGIVLVSTVLAFQTLNPAVANDLPHVLALPTIAAAAWYHGRTDPGLGDDLESVVAAAETFATGPYASYLLREAKATDDERKSVAATLSGLTGLPVEWLLRSRLRVGTKRFRKQLLDTDEVVGHFDGRLLGRESDAGAAETSDDISFWTVRGPFTAAFHAYLRDELGRTGDEPYRVFQNIEEWPWGEAGDNRYVETASDLRTAMLRNPAMRVFMANGLYDFATPFAAAEWTLEHLMLPGDNGSAVEFHRYPAGHMMYADEACLSDLASDLERFYHGG